MFFYHFFRLHVTSVREKRLGEALLREGSGKNKTGGGKNETIDPCEKEGFASV